jgi:DNA-binding MarR family transcriptional regulator
MTSRVEVAFAKHELTFMYWLVMEYLLNGKARIAAELCRQIHYDSGALTRIIDHLSKRGFIETQPRYGRPQIG